MDTDMMCRIKAFDWLADQVDVHGDVLPYALLRQGFEFQGQRVPLVSPQGIHKPGIMDLPLSITTTPGSPYGDAIGQEGYLHYHYRGTDPHHRDNAGLRRVFQSSRPLVYLYGVAVGRYLAVWPVYIIGDDPATLTFTVNVDDVASVDMQASAYSAVKEGAEARRAYITTTTRQRLHQRLFRERVLDAYRSQCAFCRLRHRELLDAAHIIPDRLPEGEPVVSNGIALCTLHHAAFDKYIIGVTPDYIIRVRPDVLEEEDGPVLLHGLQELHGERVILPRGQRDWPSRESLAWRWERFLEVA